MRAAIVIGAVLACVVLAGCPSTMPRTTVQTVSVPVPVECRVHEPARPALPTEALRSGQVSLDAFVAAAAAEIEAREGYELELRAALQACARSMQ
ncbi:MAG: hypothetical protein EOO29_14170 [Comamonadaceae bacterium]|nr:MAG: hypothetical protein EOO29_14170 [Comamonadaceae bacterium]